MARQVTADANWNRDKAPEYPPAAGAKVSTEAHGAVETATEARAGVTGHNASLVLAISTAAVIVAFAVIWLVFWG
jgi:hypothetical protein